MRHDRLPAEGIGAGWATATPDLIVEVLSPTASADALGAKLDDYRVAGTRVAWIIDPVTRTVTERVLDDPSVADIRLTEHTTIDGSPALTGFSLRVSHVFEAVRR